MYIHMYVCILLKYKTGNAQRLGHGVCLLSEGLHANSWLIVASLRETAYLLHAMTDVLTS